MIKVGLIGIGVMGKEHLSQYTRLMKEDKSIKLTALCDIDEKKLSGNNKVEGNIGELEIHSSFDKFNKYNDYKKMIADEDLDFVDITLPTFLHAEAAIYAMQQGLNVLCEKPMALNTKECQMMIDASKDNNKILMIAQCLRFWPEYRYLKSCVDDNRYGNVVSGYFFRGGSTPLWSWDNWLMDGERSGGCILDQHVHDIDMINYLFGMPQAVSSLGTKNIKSTGYDAVSTNYSYLNMTINAQDDWTINGKFGFKQEYRVNFEKASLHFNGSGIKIYPHDGDGFDALIKKESAYYLEIKHFINLINEGNKPMICDIKSTMDSIHIACSEIESAKNDGAKIIL